MRPGRHPRAPNSLWTWVGLRMSGLAVGAVSCVALGMWLHFQLKDERILSTLPPQVQQEVRRLVADPHLDEARLWALFQANYAIENFLPGLRNPDWFTLLALLVTSVPFIFVFGFMMSRPLSRQFSSVAKAARQVAEGDFSARAAVSPHAPQELAGLADDFNEMSSRLEQYEREIRDSSAMLAHELRTPLNAAMGRIQGMVDDVFPHSNDQLLLVHRQLEQINRIVGDLHLLSMARAGALSLEEERFALADLVLERIQWVELELQAAGVACQLDLDSGIEVQADRLRMGQVVTIVVDNLLRYASSGGVMDVSLRQEGTRVTLIVGDRGPGVDEADLPRVQDRFWRADRSRARHSGGSGLGLSIAGAICAAHGGVLTVRNRTGGGLEVVVSINRDRAH
ncbi:MULTISPECIES: sensor histidine kinase [Stenotrophomonas]|uniref:sensor histidine kinase n=1 Tax=Stenotrophomonas TaxID=40323 RepID=UPI0015E05AAD|nr:MULTISPECIES: ATP-binding protein [Stenotrophomonas]MBA0373895.1 HAMP domain-containing protein [Stenotrophomonas maltophilia]MBA0543853.1 HAMP domain-containing protein [Stenotrophomonas maltophilia]HDS1039489.1 HAMP domain-containing protein [Stenotrophomonas maltophilia]HDS1043950.1 HAMP domain-containing protein [Stenotrophomonas maltophilia]